jgi:hypothetical protein
VVTAPLWSDLLPGGDAAGAPWAWLFTLARLPALGSAVALSFWIEARDRWPWAALTVVAIPAFAFFVVWSANVGR